MECTNKCIIQRFTGEKDKALSINSTSPILSSHLASKLNTKVLSINILALFAKVLLDKFVSNYVILKFFPFNHEATLKSEYRGTVYLSHSCDSGATWYNKFLSENKIFSFHWILIYRGIPTNTQRIRIHVREYRTRVNVFSFLSIRIQFFVEDWAKISW